MRFLFGDYALDLERRELRRGAELVEVEPQVFDLLAYLVENRDRVASKDDLLAAVWHGRIVSESTLTSRITAARQAIGDRGEQQRFIRTVSRRGFRFVGEVREQSAVSPAGTPDRKPAQDKPAQEVSFCRTSEGINLAVAVCGKGLPVVKAANWMNHVEFDWQSPVWSPLLTQLAAQFRLIRYDERGTGLSDWNVADLSFETFVRDLETVADALDLRRFALFGNAQGAAVAIVYAVRHPERVSRLVLSGGYAQGWRARGNPAENRGAQGVAQARSRRLGAGQPRLPAGFHLAHDPRRDARTVAVGQRSAARVHLTRECGPPAAGVRRHRCHPVVTARRRTDARAAQPRRRPLPVRAGADARARNPQCPVRCARKPQQRHPVARAGMAALRGGGLRLFGREWRFKIRRLGRRRRCVRAISRSIRSFAGVGGRSVSRQLRPLPARRKLRYLTWETTALQREPSVRGRHACAKSAISSAARKSQARPAAAATCSTPIPARCKPRSASPRNRRWSRRSPMRRRRSRPGPRPTRSDARGSCSSSWSSCKKSSTASPSSFLPSTARPSPTPRATSSADSKWSSSRAASHTC